jgi:hypothetical protein
MRFDGSFARVASTLLTSYHINAVGQILAYGFHEGRSHACLLVPSDKH